MVVIYGFDRTDPRDDHQRAVRAAPRDRGQRLRRRVLFVTVFDPLVELLELLFPQFPLRQQLVHFQPVHLREFEFSQPAANRPRLKRFRRLLPRQVVTPENVLVLLIERVRCCL